MMKWSCDTKCDQKWNDIRVTISNCVYMSFHHKFSNIWQNFKKHSSWTHTFSIKLDRQREADDFSLLLIDKEWFSIFWASFSLSLYIFISLSSNKKMAIKMLNDKRESHKLSFVFYDIVVDVDAYNLFPICMAQFRWEVNLRSSQIGVFHYRIGDDGDFAAPFAVLCMLTHKYSLIWVEAAKWMTVTSKRFGTKKKIEAAAAAHWCWI